MPKKILDTPWGPLHLAEAARRAGIDPNIVHKRLKIGWSVANALTLPLNSTRPPPKAPPPTKAERMARKTYRLTQAERQKLVNMYLQGLKCDYIAAVFGIRRESVSKMALRRGAPHRMPSMRRKQPEVVT